MIVAVINLKGGVGKSTTASALAYGATMRGKRVLSVDLDGQRSLSFLMKADEQAPSILELLLGKISVAETIQSTEQGELIPASPTLAGADLVVTGKNMKLRLQQILKPIKNNYDLIILDLPPGLGIVTLNALTTADCAIIPATPDILSIKGLDDINQLVEAVREDSNSSLYIAGVLLTRWNSRSVISRDLTNVIAEAAEHIGTKVFKAKIREAVAVREAQVLRQNLLQYAPKSGVADDYLSFVNEFLNEFLEGK